MSSETPRARAPWLGSLVLSLLIIGGGAGLIAWIYDTEPTAEREGATRKAAMLVETTGVERGSFAPTIVAMGTVVPARDIVSSARVAGEVVWVSERFQPGGFIAAGEPLLRLDAADYETALAQRRSELQQARAALNLEMGQQTVSRIEYEQMKDDLPEGDESLVLREPQLASVKARVAFARAAAARAQRDLERTTIAAPFDAQVLGRQVELGSQVTPGAPLARLVDVGTYWVEVTVPMARLRWLELPGGPGTVGSEVLLRHTSAWAEGQSRTGHIHKLIGELDEDTRMARVLVAVTDPLARAAGPDAPPLMLGSYVEARLRARELDDVVRLERGHLRKNDTVWVMKEGVLDVRRVDVAFRGERYAYLRGGLEPGERVVTSDLSTVVPGARLREAEAP